jgi:hypothetical protein
VKQEAQVATLQFIFSVARWPSSRPLSSNVAVLKNYWPWKIVAVSGRKVAVKGLQMFKYGRGKYFFKYQSNLAKT